MPLAEVTVLVTAECGMNEVEVVWGDCVVDIVDVVELSTEVEDSDVDGCV